MQIPKDFPVQPLGPNENPPGRTTCGTCGRSWDDDISTQWTPAPSARCPFEYFHDDEEENESETDLVGELVEALQECITDDAATCAKLGSPKLLARRLSAINQIARAAINKATKG